MLSIAQLWFVYLAITFNVFWERDITSEIHGTPIHIYTTVYTLNLLLVLNFSCCYYLLHWSFVNSKVGGIDNSSELVGSKVICCCEQVHVNSLARSNFWRRCHLLVSLESYWSILNLSIFAKGNLLLRYISNLPLGVTNEGREAIKQFLAPLPGTQVYKIGELHTIFYLCFLVLLAYLSVFTFVSLIKNTKNTCCYYGFQWKH